MSGCESVAVDRLFAESLLKHSTEGSEGASDVLMRLLAAARQGHLCIEIERGDLLPNELVEKVQAEDDWPEKPLCLFGNLLYLQKNWLFETRVYKQLTRLVEIEPEMELVVGDEQPGLNAKQNEALHKALRSHFSLITGGPGTGKSFVAAKIIEVVAKSKSCHIAIAAPTGKAAAHLKGKVSKGEVSFVGTLHSLLEIRSSRDYLEERIPLPYDFILVDEASMIDVRLFSALLSRVKKSAHLVLMGDKNQLPPVDAGSLFSDMVAMGCFPCTELTDCLRIESKDVLRLAGAITEGRVDEALQYIDLAHRMDVGFEKGIVSECNEKLWNEIGCKYPSVFQTKPDPESLLEKITRFRVLSCLRSGPLGVDALNAMFVKQFYMRAQIGEWLAIPVLITRNDDLLELFNGQMGVLLTKIREKKQCFQPAQGDVVVFPDREVAVHLLPSYEPAYFLSVHKSQGSEYDEVLLLTPKGSEKFGREVLYTAITRARTTLKIDGSKEVLKEAIASSSLKRSGLQCRFHQPVK